MPCELKKTLMSVNISNITYTNDNTANGFFDFGNSFDGRMLRVYVNSDNNFPKGTMMMLELIGVRDRDYNFTPINPIQTYIDINSPTNLVIFDFVSSTIPLPFCIGLIPDRVNEYTDIHITYGTAIEYCFRFHVECYKHRFSITIPLKARYIYSDMKTNIKCEKLELITEKDDNHFIKIICSDPDVIYYAARPHCVTHSQAPRPVVFYYI